MIRFWRAGVVMLVICASAVGARAQTPTVTPTPAIFKLVLPFAQSNPPSKSWADELVRRLSLPSFCDPKAGCGGGAPIVATGTPVNTSTATGTFTLTPTFTQTHTFTPIPTWTNTATFTQTHTFTPKDTRTNTPTFTATHTFTDTPTFTNTPTFTTTATGTASFTPTVTWTPLAIFKTIDTSSGTDPVADAPDDTLTLNATSPMVFTGDSATDTVVGSWDFSVANTWTGQQLFDAGAKWNDNDTAVFGTGNDATISYDATDMIVNPKAVGTGEVKIGGSVELFNGGGTFATTTLSGISILDNFTVDAASQQILLFRWQNTVTWEQDGQALGSGLPIYLGAVHKNPSGETRAFGQFRTVWDAQTIQADTTASNTMNSYISFNSQPTFTRINGGTLTTSDYVSFVAGGIIGAGATITNRTGFSVADITNSGTMVNQIGFDIGVLDAASTINIGLRNASSEVDTPAAVQAITAVGQAITVAAKYKLINANNNYTLTSAPTIASGIDGQIVIIRNVDTGTDVITVQDQGTLASSNLRLGATTRAIGPRDSLILRYDSTVGDWVEEGFNNVT